jgi:cytochrome c biogenesis protein CcmG/thiol:disulfide interchange protein DsbE
VVIILTLGLLIASCAGKTSQNPWIDKPAPDFRLPSLDGQAISLTDFKGKPVLINFWATWCGPCRGEMPFIQQVYEEWQGRGLILLAINIGETPSQVAEFMQSQGLSFPVLVDTEGKVAEKYNIQYIPSTFFIARDGIIQNMKVGAFQSKAEIESSLSKLINVPSD